MPDPSRGSGNFLSLALTRIMDLESEVIQALKDLGQTDLEISRKGYGVRPDQFKGIEISPHAAVIAALVVWITYFQKHFQQYGNVAPSTPTLANYGNIECRLSWLGATQTLWMERSKAIQPRPGHKPTT